MRYLGTVTSLVEKQPALGYLQVLSPLLVTRDASNAGALHVFETYFWSAPSLDEVCTRFVEQSVVLLSLVLVT